MDKTLSEADIMSELVSPEGGALDPDAAKLLLALHFTPAQVARLNELAEKNRSDSLSAVERDEMEKYMRVGNFLSLLKAKARLSLAK